MKRLHFASLIGLLLIGQAHASELTTHEIARSKCVGLILMTLTAMPSRSTVLTCAAAPALGFAAGTAWTLSRAGVAHAVYNAGKLVHHDNHKKPFINTVLNGGIGEDDALLGSIHNIGHSWRTSIIGSTVLGILFGFYKYGIKDGLKVAIGTSIAGSGLGILANYISRSDCNPDLRTNFFAKG